MDATQYEKYKNITVFEANTARTILLAVFFIPILIEELFKHCFAG